MDTRLKAINDGWDDLPEFYRWLLFHAATLHAARRWLIVPVRYSDPIIIGG